MRFFLFCFISIIVVTFSCKTEKKIILSPIKMIKASSSLPDHNGDFADKYAGVYAFDNTKMGWCEGKKGNGIGETITVTFKKEIKIPVLYIYNGTLKDFKKKNRVKTLIVTHYEKTKEVKQVTKLKDNKSQQIISFKKPLRGKKIIFEIADIYPGSFDKRTQGKEKNNDACISEISFNKITLKNKTKKLDKVIRIKDQDLFLTLQSGGLVSGFGNMATKNCRQKIMSRSSWGHLYDGRIFLHAKYSILYRGGSCINACLHCPKKGEMSYLRLFKSLAAVKKAGTKK